MMLKSKKKKLSASPKKKAVLNKVIYAYNMQIGLFSYC